MRHQSKEQIKKTNRMIAIEVIKGLIINDEIPKAIDICQDKGISPEQFRQIANNLNKEAKKIYEIIF